MANANVLFNTPVASGGSNIAVGNLIQASDFERDSSLQYDPAIPKLYIPNLDVSGVSNLGPATNVIITGGIAGQTLISNGAGGFTFGAPNAGAISNGLNFSTTGNGTAAPFSFTANSATANNVVSWNSVGAAKGDTNGNATNFGPVSNANINITGGTAGQFLTTDGTGALSWSGPISITSNVIADSTGVNASVLFFNLTTTPSPVSGTGVISLHVPNVAQFRTAANIGNVANLNLDGNASNILYGNGVFANAPTATAFTVNYPTDLSAVASTWTAAADTLTSNGCILISSAVGGPFSNGPLAVATGGTFYTKWDGAPGSGTCIDSANGTTINGNVINSSATAVPGTLIVDKTPDPAISFTNATAQALSSVTESNQVTVSGINSYGYITGSITAGTGTTLEVSVNGGGWQSVPAAGNGVYVTSGQTVKLRLTNPNTNGITTTATVNIGTQTGITWSSTTVAVGPAVATPSITAPIAAATGISLTPTITSSAFSSSGGAGIHASSDWELYLDDGAGNPTGPVVASVTGSATDLTSWTPSVTLNSSTKYVARVRYTSTATVTTSTYSAWSSFTTQAGGWTYRKTFTESGQATYPAEYQKSRPIIWDGTQYVGYFRDWTAFTSPAQGPTEYVYSSSDGITWTRHPTQLPNIPGKQFHNITYNSSLGKYFISTMGTGGPAAAPEFATSNSPGGPWTLESTSPSTDNIFQYQTNGNMIGTSGGTKFWNSTDGINWTPATVSGALPGPVSLASEVKWTGNKYVAASADDPSFPTIPTFFTSTNGTSWTAEVPPSWFTNDTTIYRTATKGSGDEIIAAYGTFGADSGLIRSINGGGSWTDVTSSMLAAIQGAVPATSSVFVEDLVWNGSKYVALARNNSATKFILNSTDGITWQLDPQWESVRAGLTSFTQAPAILTTNGTNQTGVWLGNGEFYTLP